MTDADVIAAIRRQHLKANIAEYEQRPGSEVWILWDSATVDRGGTIFGGGPYLKVPVRDFARDGDGFTVRVYPPARLRRRLAKAWVRDSE